MKPSDHSGSERLVALDVLKGLAIGAVVVYHAVAKAQETGLGVSPAGSAIQNALDLFHVHLFMFVSGLLYGVQRLKRPNEQGFRRYWPFVGRKALRLLVPCAAVGALDWSLRHVLEGWVSQSDVPLHHVLLFSYKRFWFLQALFILFAVGPLLPRRPIAALPALIGAYVLSMLLWDVSDFLSLDRAIQMAPYFVFGYTVGLLGERALGWRPPWWGLAALGAVASASMTLVVAAFCPPPPDVPDALYEASRRVASTSTVIFLWLFIASCVDIVPPGLVRPMATGGRDSMVIYLFHVPAMIPARVLPWMLDVTYWGAFALAATVLGLLGPYVLKFAVFDRAQVLRALLLGDPFQRSAGRWPPHAAPPGQTGDSL